MSFNKHKQSLWGNNSVIIGRNNVNVNDIPDQFSDYMKNVNTRFSEICELYLKGMSIDDVQYLIPEDLINLVPQKNYQHKLLMTIMVRRYLYYEDEKKCCQTPCTQRHDVIVSETQCDCSRKNSCSSYSSSGST
jgi:hypothetical protein